MKIYTVYKTTNLINGKIYVGVHKTSNPNDSYFGSGIYIKEAISLYGKRNFKKEILAVFDTAEEAYKFESEYVNEDFVNRDDTYNLVCGGSISPDWCESRIESNRRRSGENHPCFGKFLSEEHKKKISESSKGRVFSDESRRKISEGQKGRVSVWKGKNQTKESNAKRSIAHLNLEKVVCPHCGKSSDPGNAKRWHFDKCTSLS